MNDFDYREQKKGYIMDESYNGEEKGYIMDDFDGEEKGYVMDDVIFVIWLVFVIVYIF